MVRHVALQSISSCCKIVSMKFFLHKHYCHDACRCRELSALALLELSIFSHFQKMISFTKQPPFLAKIHGLFAILDFSLQNSFSSRDALKYTGIGILKCRVEVNEMMNIIDVQDADAHGVLWLC